MTTQSSPIRDSLIVVAITVGAAVMAAHFELNEIVFSITRRWEHLQLDEWPIALLVFALGLIWLSWRRNAHARAELRARQVAEAELAAALRENRALGHQHLRALEAERKHLARELHDELGQYLNAIKLDAVAIRDEQDARYEAPASRVLKAVDRVHGVVSDMIRRLRPAGLDELGLLAAIEGCVDQWRQRSPQTSFALSTTGDFEGLDEPTSLALYRLVQECLTNSFKHAKARHIEVKLRKETRGEMILSVRDDGRGLDPHAHTTGFGLSSMRERVEMLGGRLEIQSSAGQGCAVEAYLPYSRGAGSSQSESPARLAD